MKALDRKLLRDLARMKTQALAIALVMASGVATFLMSICTYASMEQTRARYYEEFRFAHVFAHLKRAPNTIVARIAEIPGVAQVQARVVADVTLDIPGMAEPAAARLISVPELEPPRLNALYLRSGRYLEPRRRGEVLVDQAFAEAHGFVPGDRLRAIINSKLEELTIVGIALSPEYVYTIRPGELLPDNRRFGVLWMGYEQLAAAFDMRNAFNDVALTLMHGANEPDALKRLDAIIDIYGGRGAYSRADQTSHRFVSDELQQLRAMSTIAPAIFLAVAAFLINVVLNRLINTQREQIAALKAFGYTGREIALHFFKLAAVIVLVGTLLGTAGGAWLGRGISTMYMRFFRFPVFDFTLDPGVVLLAATVSATAALLAVIGAVRRAVKLPPAEAMRPEAPTDYRPLLAERLGLQRLYSASVRMILRHIERKPARAAFSILGVALAIGVVVLGSFSRDIVAHIIDVQFNLAQRFDFNIAFVEPLSASSRHDVSALPGALRMEPYRSVPVRLRNEHRSRRVAITGIEPDGQLVQIIDTSSRRVPVPPDGLLLSRALGELLNVRPGERVTVEILEGTRHTVELPVAALVNDFSGLSAYMNRTALNAVMREGDSVSGAFLASDEEQTGALYTAIKSTPRVATVTSLQGALASFQRTISENLQRIRFFNILFGCIIAGGVVYNSARISFAERSRELATLRVIGFTRGEISAILLGEVGFLTILGIPLGMLFGYGFAALATTALQTETQRFVLIVNPATYAFAVTVTVIAAIGSGLIVRRQLDRLDLVSVLKSKD